MAPLAEPSLPPLYKVTRLRARVPVPEELPGVVGRLQRHRVAEQETVLMIGLAAGVGFRALRAANPNLNLDRLKPGDSVSVPINLLPPVPVLPPP